MCLQPLEFAAGGVFAQCKLARKTAGAFYQKIAQVTPPREAPKTNSCSHDMSKPSQKEGALENPTPHLVLLEHVVRTFSWKLGRPQRMLLFFCARGGLRGPSTRRERLLNNPSNGDLNLPSAHGSRESTMRRRHAARTLLNLRVFALRLFLRPFPLSSLLRPLPRRRESRSADNTEQTLCPDRTTEGVF